MNAQERSITSAPDAHVASLVDRFLAVRGATEDWIRQLEPGDFVLQSMPDASPIGWHLAHTTWFFEEFLLGALDPAYRAFHPSYQFLFNSYYEAVGERVARHRRGMLSRPTAPQILDYREHVNAQVAALAPTLEGDARDRAIKVIGIGIQHEQQHQELMATDLKHAFAQNPMLPAISDTQRVAEPSSGFVAEPLGFQRFAEGLYSIGVDRPEGADAFAFDNEGPRHRVFLQAFELGCRPVTNAEWLAFMEAGGYERPEHWLSAGWARATDREDRWVSPLYWRRDADRGWVQFTAHGEEAVDPEGTVTHISYYEADAFARWSGCRLPTEFEWEVACAHQPSGERGRFRESGAFHPGRAAALGQGLHRMLGDTWEWTSSAYAAYPGFSTDEGALGEYNGKFMSGQFILRGGSCATPQSHIRPTYRNFFPPDARWQFSGLRLARNVTQ